MRLLLYHVTSEQSFEGRRTVGGALLPHCKQLQGDLVFWRTMKMGCVFDRGGVLPDARISQAAVSDTVAFLLASLPL